MSTNLHPSIAEQLSHFRFAHLPPHLQEVSAPFSLMAVHLVRTIPAGPGVTRALGHLRRAKDEAVTAAINANVTDDDLAHVARGVLASADEWLATHGAPFGIVESAP